MAQDKSGQGKLTMQMLLRELDRDIAAQRIPILKETLIEWRTELVAAQTVTNDGTDGDG